MKRNFLTLNLNKASISLSMLLLTFGLSAQTNVFDDVIATSPNHTYLEAALIQEGLDVALQNPMGTLTVFAPDDAAFTALATALGTDIPGLLALPNLADILTYHVLGSTVLSAAVTNGAIVQPLSITNTLKLTRTSGGNVFVNQAQVMAPDLTAANGVVHSMNGVLLPVQTVVDVALGSAVHTTLVAAVVEARLLPALTNPLSQLTVFAPTNMAFDNLATALGTNLAGILAHPQLADILLYHVIGSEVLSGALMNGPVATLNGQSVIINLMSGVMVNNATVTTADIQAYNGVVHIIDAVLVPSLNDINETTLETVKISPNPSSDVIVLSTISSDDFTIVNAAGTVVKTGKVVNNEITISDLENGTYFLQLSNNEGTYQAKFIKL